jgi:cyclopropane fatty-acyl-phospholipid synthase-like methyltransferase
MTPDLKSNPYENFDHDEFSRSKPRDDFLGQIRRTVNGHPVSEEQMELIENSLVLGLQLSKEDKILDLACGNGILSKRLFEKCSGLHGVDLSAFLISVAQEYFQNMPRYKFSQSDIVDFLRNDSECLEFNKVICYGSFSYLSEEAAKETLSLLYTKYPNVSRVYIGNLPDYDKRHLFFTRSAPREELLQVHTTTIGIWRSEEEFCALSSECGWKPTIRHIDESFYSSKYRYDVLLKRETDL